LAINLMKSIAEKFVNPLTYEKQITE
jgi:hypothetical protein